MDQKIAGDFNLSREEFCGAVAKLVLKRLDIAESANKELLAIVKEQQLIIDEQQNIINKLSERLENKHE